MAPVFGSGFWQRSHFQKLDFAEMKRSCCCCAAANSASFCFLSLESSCFITRHTDNVHKPLCEVREIAWLAERTEFSVP